MAEVCAYYGFDYYRASTYRAEDVRRRYVQFLFAWQSGQVEAKVLEVNDRGKTIREYSADSNVPDDIIEQARQNYCDRQAFSAVEWPL